MNACSKYVSFNLASCHRSLQPFASWCCSDKWSIEQTWSSWVRMTKGNQPRLQNRLFPSLSSQSGSRHPPSSWMLSQWIVDLCAWLGRFQRLAILVHITSPARWTTSKDIVNLRGALGQLQRRTHHIREIPKLFLAHLPVLYYTAMTGKPRWRFESKGKGSRQNFRNGKERRVDGSEEAW